MESYVKMFKVIFGLKGHPAPCFTSYIYKILTVSIVIDLKLGCDFKKIA